MKTLIYIIPFRLCAFTGVGCHCLSNIDYVYKILGYNLHFYQLAASILGIYAFVLLREFHILRFKSPMANYILLAAEMLLEAMILLPFIMTSHGTIIYAGEVHEGYWPELITTLLGILLFRVFIYLFSDYELIA